MVDSFVKKLGDATGTNVQTFENTVGGNVVDAQAVVLVNTAGAAVTTLPVSMAAAPTGAALDATLTGGTAKAIMRGGAKGATAAADATSTAEGADHQAVDVQVYHAGTAVNPAAIRALTSADAVTAVQGTAAGLGAAWPVRVTDLTNVLPTMDAAGRAGFQKITDGTNTLPTMDAVGRAGFQRITDGVNSMPTMDAVARAGFQKVTDGTNVQAVKAASTAAVAADPASVVAFSPNSNVVSTKFALSPAAPTAVSVGVASGAAVASNASRTGLALTNTSPARISLGLGSTAVLDSGITLYPGGTFQMDEGTFFRGPINAIASAAASNLAVQEFS